MSSIVLATDKVHPSTRIFDMPERIIKIPFSQNATQKSTGITLKSGLWISDVFVNVVTNVASSYLNVGLGESGVDNLIDYQSCATAGWFYRDAIESKILPPLYGAVGGNFVNTSAGLAIGGTNTKIKTANAIEYYINGVRYTKAATDDLFAPSTGDTTGGTKYGGNLLYLDAAGTGSCVAMTTEATTAAGIVFPDPQVADKCCIGKVTYNLSTGVFDVGTTAFNAANTTVAYTNAVSGTNGSSYGLTDGPRIVVPNMGMRLTSDYEVFYTTTAHAIAGFIYIVVKGGFE